MKKITYLALAAALITPFSAIAQFSPAIEFLYEQPLEGVYSQGWSGVALGSDLEGVNRMYVLGTGKLGDFAGIYEVNCWSPEQSYWVAVADTMRVEDVPPEAMDATWIYACGG
jgi:hypothetical protein